MHLVLRSAVERARARLLPRATGGIRVRRGSRQPVLWLCKALPPRPPLMNTNQAKEQLVILLLSLLGSVVAGFAPNWTGAKMTSPEQIFLSVDVFLACLLLDILWILSARYVQETRM